MNTSNTPLSYTDIGAIKDYWKNIIGPSYFDFNDVNNYNIGIFGYVNEILANTTEDSFNAISVARREFYPASAQYMSSLYKMATLQSIGVPVATPAICRCALILNQDEVISNSTFNNGIGECVIDSSLKIQAGDLTFMIDYPIIILSKKTDVWIHTIRYDTSISNSLGNSSSTYISNQVLAQDGVNYLILFLEVVRQVDLTEISNVVINDSLLDTFTQDIDFSGDIANFEIFYKESSNSPELQLRKVMIDSVLPKVPYVQYNFINDTKIRLTFAYNAIFNPKVNSEIICRIYTSSGADGNFNSYNKDSLCTVESDKYPYNANMTMIGKMNGSAIGGADKPTTEEFREKVLRAYSTNNTITTSNDLQLYFDEQSESLSNVKILFKKKRDDPFIRLFGAYTTMKDTSENIVPTNTLEIELLKSDVVDDLTSTTSRVSIPSGIIFEYKADDSYLLNILEKPDGTPYTILDIPSNPDIFTKDAIYFTNPFLIGVNIDPNNVGYYQNSLNKYMPIEYLYVNDDSVQQFIGSTVNVYRNSMTFGQFYKISISLMPASAIDPTTMVIIHDPDELSNQKIAKYNGRVIKEEYVYDEAENLGFIQYTIEYATTNTSEQFETIQGSNSLPINRESVVGYKMNYYVGDSFIEGDIIATKRVSDLGNLVVCVDLSKTLYSNGYYIPLSIQDYDASLNAYTMEAYVSTDDIIDFDENVVIKYGIYDSTGAMNTNVAISMKDQVIELNALYNNPGNNIQHKYSSFVGLNGFTLTNTYSTAEDDKFDFVSSLQFIRSDVSLLPGGTDPLDFKIRISESPMLSAVWASYVPNYNYFINEYTSINEIFGLAFYALENNFSIDSKFYNTYGKARFYTIGNSEDSLIPLNSVRCSFRFGVRLNTIASTELFITSFREYVKSYVEDTNSLTSSGRDIYILNMVSAIKANFSEIMYIEYYGMNIYDYSAQKIVGPALDSYWSDFIPEFVNMNILYDSNNNPYPDVSVDILTV